MTRVEWCQICEDYYSESELDVRKHIMETHTLDERLKSLHEKGPEPEDTYK